MPAALSLPDLQDQDRDDWTVDDLASLPKDLRYELVDGTLVLPSPTGIHQIFGIELVLMLRRNCPAGYSPVPDLSLRVNRHNEPRPDVVVLRDDLLASSPAPIEGSLLVVEVISPDSHFRDMHAKLKVYASAGVGSYWVIDPTFDNSVVLTQFRLADDGQYEIVTNTGKLFTTDVPYPVTIDLPALTDLHDKYRGDPVARRPG